MLMIKLYLYQKIADLYVYLLGKIKEDKMWTKMFHSAWEYNKLMVSQEIYLD